MIRSLASIQVLLRSSIRQSKQRQYLAVVMLLMALLLSIRYWGNQQAPSSTFFKAYLQLFIPFSSAFFLQFFFWRGLAFLRKSWFWLLVFLSPAIFVSRSALSISVDSFLSAASLSESIRATIHYGSRAIILILPLAFIWFYSSGKQKLLPATNFKPNYPLLGLLLAFMLPLIILAANQAEFAAVYPKAISYAGLQKDDSILKWLIFELGYAFDFLSIEVFFRGFLVMAFTRYVGLMAIMPAACFYCCIHFDKPMAEAISSFFGGLLLGCISYYTRNIWTGFLLHLAMAWLMELTCFYIYHW